MASAHEVRFTTGQLPIGALVLDAEGGVVEVNERALGVLGVEGSLVGRPLSDLVVEGDRSALASLLDGGAEDDATPTRVRLDRTPPRWIEVAASALDGGHLVVVSDVTDAMRTFRVLREALWTAVVIDEQGFRLWGPVGREHPADRPNELPGSVVDRIHPEDVATMVQLHEAVQAQPGRRERAVVRMRELAGRGGAGSESWGTATIEMVNLSHVPEIDGILVAVHDRLLVEQVGSIGRTTGSYLSVAEAAPVGIILTGPAGFPVYFNDSSRQLLAGVGGGDAERDWIGFASEEARDELRAWVDGLVARAEQGSRTVRFEGDPPRWLLVTVAPRVAEDGTVVGFVVTLQDVTAEVEAREALEVAQERLVHMAHHDPLTSLGNRELVARAIDRFGPEEVARDEGGVGVLFGDLDGFKEVNDRLGHHVGDQVLVAVAERLRAVVRPTDLVARMGGDEFLVLAHPIDPAELAELGARLGDHVRQPIVVDGATVSVGISLGAEMLGGGEDLDDVLRRADAAMYERKASSGVRPDVVGGA